MAESKEAYYWTQLYTAFTAGQWDSPAPAKTPKGTYLSWPELFRKFRKHSGRHDATEAAIQIHFLSLLLQKTKRPTRNAVVDEGHSEDLFDLGDECVLYKERREDVQKAYEALQQIKSREKLLHTAKAYLAYALNRPSACIEHIRFVEYDDILPEIPAVGAERTCEYLWMDGDLEDGAEVDEGERGQPISEGPPLSLTFSPIEIENEKAWALMEAIRTHCLTGMSLEHTYSDSPVVILRRYDQGVHLLRCFAIPKSPPVRPGRANSESFDKYRELWRWSERLLWRAIMLSAQYRHLEYTIPIFRTYTSHSVHWPATFRSARRPTICLLYLRALILLVPKPQGQSELFQSKSAWTHEMRSVVHECRAILTATTRFPHAGERNVHVEEFVDLCVAAWEAGGAIGDQAGWVLDILWWATRLTFNCSRVFRHMTRLLHVSGDHSLAKRVLRLYVQVVKKARETGTMNEQGEDTHDSDAMESDAIWVQTLVQGARMLCRVDGGAEEAWEAAKLIEMARERCGNLGDELIASVDLAEGICKSTLANREQEPSTRGNLLSQAIDLINRSIERHSTPSAYFHASLALSRPTPERNLERAVEYCRKAIEEEPTDVRYWHVLALLEAKLGEWKKARGVLEAAIDIAEEAETRVQTEEQRENGIVTRDYGDAPNGRQTPTQASHPRIANGGAKHTSSAESGTLVEGNSHRKPPAADLLKSLPDHPPPNNKELFEHALQLRMTQLALTELVEGPESVDGYWLETFDWYSLRRDTNAQARGSTRPSLEIRLTPSPAFLELDPHETTQSLNDVPESSSSAITISNGHSDAPSSSDGAATARLPGRASLETSVGNSLSDSPRPTSPASQRRDIEKERNGEKEKVILSSQSPERDRDKRGKRMQKMLKNQVHKQGARINTISKKIGHGVTGGMGLHRSSSAPDFHASLTRTGPYQASSIHSRRRISFSSKSQRTTKGVHTSVEAPSPPPPPLPPSSQVSNGVSNRTARERRLLSDLWLMSAATFRRLDKLDQTRGAIQEAENLDEENASVWVQLGLYFSARGEEGKAIESFHKAMFISQDDCSATIHLCRLYLTSQSPLLRSSSYGAIDLAAGMLEELTRGVGWDVPEAWYLLAKAYSLQGRIDRERECLVFALGLVEVRGARDIGTAVGWCL